MQQHVELNRQKQQKSESAECMSSGVCCRQQRLLGRPNASGVTSHRQPRQCRGGQGPKTVKGAQSDPNCVSRPLLDCVPPGISQNHHPCLHFSIPDRSLFIIPKFTPYSMFAGGPKIIVTPLGNAHPSSRTSTFQWHSKALRGPKAGFFPKKITTAQNSPLSLPFSSFLSLSLPPPFLPFVPFSFPPLFFPFTSFHFPPRPSHKLIYGFYHYAVRYDVITQLAVLPIRELN